MDLYDFPMAYRGLTFNGHRTAAGALDTTKEAATFRVNQLDFGRIQFRDQREALNVLSGGDLGDAASVFRYVTIAGVIKDRTGMDLSDRIAQLFSTWSIEEALFDDPTTDGESAFTYTDVTRLDTGRGTAYADRTLTGETGYYVVERIVGRPSGPPIVTQRRSGGDTALFAAELVCSDPRRYIQTAESVVLNSGNSYSANCPNWSSLMGIATPPTVTIVTSGNGSSSFTLDIAGDGVSPLVLNLSAVGAATIVWSARTGIIQVGSTHRADLRTSAADTLFARVPRGGAVASSTNNTNITSVTLAYRQARG